MSIREKICPKCGRSEKEVSFHGFICIEDYLAEKKIKVPASIMVQLCKYGDKMFINAWTDKHSDLLPQVTRLVKARGIEISHVDLDIDRHRATVELSFAGEKLKKEIPLDVRKTLCTRAVRGYFEAIVQVRSNREPVDRDDRERIEQKIRKMADKIIATLSTETDYIKHEKVRGGIDMYTDSTAAVFKTFSDLGLRVDVHRKLWTQKKGKQLYRSTFIVRI